MKIIFLVSLVVYSYLSYTLITTQSYKDISMQTSNEKIIENGGVTTFNQKNLKYKSTLSEGIIFNKPGYPEYISSVIGMASYESWGAWTNSNIYPMARFYFVEKLPKDFDLEIKAKAYGPNKNKYTKIIVGGQEQKVKISDLQSTFVLSFRNIKNADYIEIIPPRPISPFVLSNFEINEKDVRKLGIGLISMKILKIM